MNMTNRTYIGAYGDLDNIKQVVAVIDDDLCINCGKCYMVCNDSGYQAISFSADSHIATVNACPVPECIRMVPKTTKHNINRGIPPSALPSNPNKEEPAQSRVENGRVLLAI